MARPHESVVHGSKAGKKAPDDPCSAPPAPQGGQGIPEQSGAAASLKNLPAVDRLLREPAAAALINEHGHTLVAGEARRLIDELRDTLRQRGAATAAGQPGAPRPDAKPPLAISPAATPPDAIRLDALASTLAGRVAARLQPRMRAVLNLTGTVIHTNLGRALLAEPALQHLLAMMAGPNNLEFDLATGRRGDRDDLIEDLLCTITGAEAATVVNNNAAAVLLTIAALAKNREVIVSRGELVEIGGAFRMPDVMASASARLVEVGTTNRTHARDYEGAIGPKTALVMKVHTSNYAIAGFTAAVDEATLAPIVHRHGLPLATDLGSGSLVDLSHYGLPREPLPQDMLNAGCDIVTFSGDKLLGGPQAGLIVGSKALVGKIRKHPLKRALRMSKLPLAALEATLMLYLRPERLARDLPTLRLLTRSAESIRALAEALAPALADAVAPRYTVTVVDLQGQIGSGSLPIERLASAGLALAPTVSRGLGRALDTLASALRTLPLPVIGRIADDRLLLDLRGLEDPAALQRQLPALRTALSQH